MAELYPFKDWAKVASWPILGRKMASLARFFFEIWTSNLFFPSFALILMGKPSWKSIGPKLTMYHIKPQNNFRPKIIKKRLYFLFWGLNQKSTMINIYEFIHILAILKVADKFIEKCRRSRLFGDCHLGKMGFEIIGALLWFLRGFMGQNGRFGSNRFPICFAHRYQFKWGATQI